MTVPVITALRPIETLYRGRRYRSRLEARWAAFFDLMGWRAEYEPFDLAGWIPDFVLHGAKQRVVVEVKPIASTTDDMTFWETTRKIAASGWPGEALIVGYLLPRNEFEHLCVGWLGEYTGGDFYGRPCDLYDWTTAPFQVVGDGCLPDFATRKALITTASAVIILAAALASSTTKRR